MAEEELVVIALVIVVGVIVALIFLIGIGNIAEFVGDIIVAALTVIFGIVIGAVTGAIAGAAIAAIIGLAVKEVILIFVITGAVVGLALGVFDAAQHDGKSQTIYEVVGIPGFFLGSILGAIIGGFAGFMIGVYILNEVDLAFSVSIKGAGLGAIIGGIYTAIKDIQEEK